MTLNKTSRLFRFSYYWTTNYEIPTQTTLCRFFWRTFVFLPLIYLLAAAAFSAVLYIAAAVTYRFYGIPLAALGVIVLAVTKGKKPIGRFVNARIDNLENTVNRIADSTFWKGYKSLKSAVCPIIRIE